MRKSPMTAEKHLANFWIMAKPGSKVFVAGTFNNWDAKANPLKENSSKSHYMATIAVSPGRHEYKFIVNDVWQLDPSCPVRVENQCGSENNVLQIEEPDVHESEPAHQIELGISK